MNPLRFCLKRSDPSFLIALCFLFGCGQKEEDLVSPAASSMPKRTPAARTRLQGALDSFNELPYVHEPLRRPRVISDKQSNRKQWLINVLNQGYSASGHTNRQWTDAARQSFTAYADYSREATDAAHYSALTNAVADACSKGCDDPMIGYMRVRYGVTGSNYTKETFALDSLGAFRAMLSSQYHPLLKFMAGLRTVQACYAAEPKGNRSPANQFVMACLEDLARDTNAPATDVFECSYMWIDFGTGFAWSAYVTSQLEGIIGETWGNDARFFELRGLGEVSRAWQARGGGFADKVTEQGWNDFRAHLNQAALALETAWQMNPTNARTAYNMMQVELGQGQGLARMEKWFNRAMNLSPDYYDAVKLMSFYLEPRWYGSEEKAFRFARSCVSSTNWNGRVPLILADVHRSVANYYKLSGGPDHWAQPGVWEDIRSSYEKFFKLNPDDYGYRHDYARDAYACGRYDEFLAQTRLFAGGTNFEFFGGEEQFRQMLRQASAATRAAK
jgi:tetratricopeptide (TPR) repeat protein